MKTVDGQPSASSNLALSAYRVLDFGSKPFFHAHRNQRGLGHIGIMVVAGFWLVYMPKYRCLQGIPDSCRGLARPVVQKLMGIPCGGIAHSEPNSRGPLRYVDALRRRDGGRRNHTMRDQWESTFAALDRLMAETDGEAQGIVPEQR